MKITELSICQHLHDVLDNYDIANDEDFSITTFIEDITLNHDTILEYIKMHVCSDGCQDIFCPYFKSYMYLVEIAILSLYDNNIHSKLQSEINSFAIQLCLFCKFS